MKPNALDMLKLDPDAFMVEVSRAISPKPWGHRRVRPKGLMASPNDLCFNCQEFAVGDECPVPPTITDPPEVVARKLRDKANISMVRRAIRECGFTQDSTNDSAVHALDYWYAYDATPYEQITCCLVARGLWQVEAEGDPK